MGQQAFSVKGQMINIVAFVKEHTWSLTHVFLLLLLVLQTFKNMKTMLTLRAVQKLAKG